MQSAQALEVDFQPADTGVTQAGYTPLSGGINDGGAGLFPTTGLVVAGDAFNMQITDGGGGSIGMETSTAGAIAGTTQDDLLRDGIFEASNLRILFLGLDPTIQYEVTFYFHEEDGAVQGNSGFSFQGRVGNNSNPFTDQTLGHSGSGNAIQTPSTASATFFSEEFSNQGLGQYVQFNFIGGTGNGIYLNGFDLEVVPEPSSAVLLGLGALAMIRRRR